MLAYTASRRSRHGGGGERRDEDDPESDQPRPHRGVRDLLHAAPPSRSPRCRSSAAPGGEYFTSLGLPEEEGGSAGDPILGVVRRSISGRSSRAGVYYVGLLAATVLFLATNAGLIGVSRLVYSMGIHRQLPDAPAPTAPEVPDALDRDPALLGDRDRARSCRARPTSSAASTRSARCCRSRSPTPPWRGCAAKKKDVPRPYRGPGNAPSGATTRRCSRSSAGTFTFIAFIVIACSTRWRRSASAGSRSASPSTSSTAAGKAST